MCLAVQPGPDHVRQVLQGGNQYDTIPLHESRTSKKLPMAIITRGYFFPVGTSTSALQPAAHMEPSGQKPQREVTLPNHEAETVQYHQASRPTLLNFHTTASILLHEIKRHNSMNVLLAVQSSEQRSFERQIATSTPLRSETSPILAFIAAR